LRARRLRPSRARLGDVRAGAIAVDARRRDVHEALWYPAGDRQRGQQLLRARVVAPFAGRRCEVHHAERRGGQPAQRAEVVEIPDDRRNAVRTQSRHLLDATDEPAQACAAREVPRRTHRDVAAADQENAKHFDVRTRAVGSIPATRSRLPAPCRKSL
jgi:hypothetical protein